MLPSQLLEWYGVEMSPLERLSYDELYLHEILENAKKATRKAKRWK